MTEMQRVSELKLEDQINRLYDKSNGFNEEDFRAFREFLDLLNSGSIRAAQPRGKEWQTNLWVKKGILIGFRMGSNIEMKWSSEKTFIDKHTYPEKKIGLADKIRLVPGGSSVRDGCFIGKHVTIMPPAYINVGAYVDDGTMIDSHALVGSCAQIGKNVHLSAAAMIGGVLEPIGNNPVIIEDDAFIGGNCGIYEGVIVKSRAIIAAGVILTSSLKVYDAVNRNYITSFEGKPLTIPENAVVISGTRQAANHDGIAVYCPIITKYRDEKSEKSVRLEDSLR
jgi:2,3,4,5-tetrahydropyridine-2,6-dicarboxylate N-succinyltransferase